MSDLRKTKSQTGTCSCFHLVSDLKYPKPKLRTLIEHIELQPKRGIYFLALLTLASAPQTVLHRGHVPHQSLAIIVAYHKSNIH